MLLSFSSIGPRAVSSRQEIELIQLGPTVRNQSFRSQRMIFKELEGRFDVPVTDEQVKSYLTFLNVSIGNTSCQVSNVISLVQ